MFMPFRTLDLDLLRTFVAIVDEGGFTRAGERVGRSQSAVSLQVKRLEEVVGAQLFSRAPRRRPAPTPAGEALIGHARQLLQLNDVAMAELTEPNVSGLVRLGVPEDFATIHLPNVLAAFTEAHPQVELEVTCDLTLNLQAGFRDGRFDLVLVKREPDVSIRGQRVWREPLVWVARDASCVRPNEPLPLIVSPVPCVYRRRATNALDSAGQAWRVAYTCTSLAGTQAAVRAGLGLAVLPREMCPDSLKPLPAHAKLPQLADTEIALIEAPGTSRTARRFAEHIVAALGA